MQESRFILVLTDEAERLEDSAGTEEPSVQFVFPLRENTFPHDLTDVRCVNRIPKGGFDPVDG